MDRHYCLITSKRNLISLTRYFYRRFVSRTNFDGFDSRRYATPSSKQNLQSTQLVANLLQVLDVLPSGGWRHWGEIFRDWSLIAGRGATKREGGHVKFYPMKRGGGKSFSHAEGGAQKVLG